MRAFRWVFHPFLFAVYFVLALAAPNADELTGWLDPVWPAAVSLLVCSLCCIVGLAITREPQKAALVGLLWLVAFSVYGYVAETLRSAGTLALVAGESGLCMLFGAALFGPSLAIRRAGRQSESFNRYLTLVAVLLLGYTAATVGVEMLRDDGAPTAMPLPTLSADRTAVSDRRDIFLIILDKYTGGEVLSSHFDFDNGEFEDFLRDRGFVVPHSAQANYPLTLPALASMLNLDYLHALPHDLPLNEAVANNRVAGFLKSQGYRFAFFPTGYRLTHRSRLADVQLLPPEQDRGEFAAVWVATTMLPELARGACALAGCDGARILTRAQLAEIMDWKFDRIQGLAGGGQPTFVLAHLLLPHEPYLYHADCSHREPYWPAGFGLLHDEAATHGYLDQIRCANRKLKELVDSLLARSARPPVILLQADHGHGRFGKVPPLEKLSSAQVRERMSVFAAYFLPDLPVDAIADSVTPVNALRLVLRHYLQADLPPLEEAGYWVQNDNRLGYTRIR
jgi:hypothetical protein